MKEDASDAHEERNMWNQIVTDIKKLRIIQARATEVSKLQIDMESKIGNCKQMMTVTASIRIGICLYEFLSWLCGLFFTCPSCAVSLMPNPFIYVEKIPK